MTPRVTPFHKYHPYNWVNTHTKFEADRLTSWSDDEKHTKRKRTHTHTQKYIICPMAY